MNTRKAKRLKIGKYKEEGFHIRLVFRNHQKHKLEQLLDSFLEAIEGKSLCTYMSCKKNVWEGIILNHHSYTKTTEEDKQFCRNLARELEAETCSISRNFDLNNEKDTELALQEMNTSKNDN